MGSLWQVTRNDDGTFTLLRDGRVLHAAIPDKWLEDELVRYGITGHEYQVLRGELATRETAVLDFSEPWPLP